MNGRKCLKLIKRICSVRSQTNGWDREWLLRDVVWYYYCRQSTSHLGL